MISIFSVCTVFYYCIFVFSSSLHFEKKTRGVHYPIYQFWSTLSDSRGTSEWSVLFSCWSIFFNVLKGHGFYYQAEVKNRNSSIFFPSSLPLSLITPFICFLSLLFLVEIPSNLGLLHLTHNPLGCSIFSTFKIYPEPNHSNLSF